MNPHFGPLLQAEIDYRQARIAHDFAAASRWQKGLRRAGRRLWRHEAPTPTPRQVVRRASAH